MTRPTTIVTPDTVRLCLGKNMSKETVGTLGGQKATNYALRADMTREEFIAEVTDGLMPPPGYFPMNVAMNKQGYDSIDRVMAKTRALSPETFEVTPTRRTPSC